jgi:hypothetical protein
MNIVVCVKQVPDTAAERMLSQVDGTLDRAPLDGLINELDEYAIEEGLRISETHGGEVTILSMGSDKAAESIRKALSMAEVPVLAVHSNGEVKKVTGELLTAARRLGEPAVVWAGPGADAGRERLAEFFAARVYVADGGEFDDFVVVPKAELLAALLTAKAPAAVLIAGTLEGKEVAGRLSVKANSPTSLTSPRAMTAPQSPSTPVSSRPDRQDRLPAALHRGRDLRRHPAPCRHADLQDHHRHQQGPRGTHIRDRRLRRYRRSLRRRPPAT